jgi:hypothetical protein
MRRSAWAPPDLTERERPIFDQVSGQLSATPPAPVRIDRELDDGEELAFGGGGGGAVVVAVPFLRLAGFDTDIACFGHGEPVTQDAAVQLRAAARQLSDHNS